MARTSPKKLTAPVPGTLGMVGCRACGLGTMRVYKSLLWPTVIICWNIFITTPLMILMFIASSLELHSQCDQPLNVLMILGGITLFFELFSSLTDMAMGIRLRHVWRTLNNARSGYKKNPPPEFVVGAVGWLHCWHPLMRVAAFIRELVKVCLFSEMIMGTIWVFRMGSNCDSTALWSRGCGIAFVTYLYTEFICWVVCQKLFCSLCNHWFLDIPLKFLLAEFAYSKHAGAGVAAKGKGAKAKGGKGWSSSKGYSEEDASARPSGDTKSRDTEDREEDEEEEEDEDEDAVDRANFDEGEEYSVEGDFESGESIQRGKRRVRPAKKVGSKKAKTTGAGTKGGGITLPFTTDGSHVFAGKRFHDMSYFCDVCNRRFHSWTGLACGVCGYAVHSECHDKAEKSCKRPTRPRGKPEQPEHQWLRSNCPDGALPSNCIVCNKNTGCMRRGEKNWRCLWCHASVHADCKEKGRVPPVCSMGLLRRMVIPPEYTHIRGTEVSFTQPPDCTPLLCLVNRKAGNLTGEVVFRKLQRLLNPAQVWDLAQGGPEPGLMAFRGLKDVKVLGCGGDGTVGWTLVMLDKLELDYEPVVGTIPLGTSNDMSRKLGFGGGYTGEDVASLLTTIDRGKEMVLDRWLVQNIDRDGTSETKAVMNNYWSVGIDAMAALDFHTAREKDPGRFNSRCFNKSYYVFGAARHFCCDCGVLRLRDVFTVTVDDEEIDLGNAAAVILANLNSYAGGFNPWGNKPPEPWKPSLVGDELIEVVAVDSYFHLGRWLGDASRKRIGGSPRRLAQGSRIVFQFRDDWSDAVKCQVDGEPYLQDPLDRIEITHHNQRRMLIHPNVAT